MRTNGWNTPVPTIYPCPRLASCAGVRKTPPLRTADAGGSVLEGDAVKSKKQVVMVELVSGVAQEVDRAFTTPLLQSHKTETIIINARVFIFFQADAGMASARTARDVPVLIHGPNILIFKL